MEKQARGLLIHGNLTTGGFWRYVAEQLPEDVRVIAPDMRGFGRTDAEPMTATNGADELLTLLERTPGHELPPVD